MVCFFIFGNFFMKHLFFLAFMQQLHDN
jgi:hypothetical protein